MREYRFVCDDCGVQSPALPPGTAASVCAAHECGRTCAACGWRKIQPTCRGLCQHCFGDVEIRLDFPRQTRQADDLLDDWQMLRDDGYTLRDAAARIGVSVTALDRALSRAKRRGDPRGSRTPFGHEMAAP